MEQNIRSDCEIQTNNSNNLNAICTPIRSKSPINVQQWIASLPDEEKNKEEEEKQSDVDLGKVTDNLTLGAEGYKELIYICGKKLF